MPDYVDDPVFAVGEEVTIRARVKTHDDHAQYGKATIITYVERIS
jgi:hypothetical protein